MSGFPNSALGKSDELMHLLRKFLSEHPEGATSRQICVWLRPLLRGVKRSDGGLYLSPVNSTAGHRIVARHLEFIGATQCQGRYVLGHSAGAPSAATLEATLTSVKQRVSKCPPAPRPAPRLPPGAIKMSAEYGRGKRRQLTDPDVIADRTYQIELFTFARKHNTSSLS